MSPRAGALATTMARQTTHKKCHSYEEKQSDVCVCVCVLYECVYRSLSHIYNHWVLNT